MIINFEDPRFDAGLDSRTLHQLFEIYLKHLTPATPVVVLDEVQNVKNWKKFVRWLLEAKKAYVLITGSSSKLLGQEISTVLTGRHLDTEVLPLSFAEFLDFRELSVANAVELARIFFFLKKSAGMGRQSKSGSCPCGNGFCRSG